MDQKAKKKETGIHGKEYEREILALIGLKCVLDVSIKDFWLMTNPPSIKLFDDIILFLEFENGSRELYFIQLKHRKTGGSLTSLMFQINAQKYKDWYLGRYQDEFQSLMKNKHLFLKKNGIDANTPTQFLFYTNRHVIIKSDKESNLCFEDISSSEIKHFLNSSKQQKAVYRFRETSCISQTFDNVFLDSLVIYSNQIHLSDIKLAISTLLHFKTDLSKRFIQTFYEFADPDNDKERLTKIDIKEAILKIVFGEYNPPVIVDNNFISNKVINLLQSYDITVITSRDSEVTLWTFFSNEIRMRYPNSKDLTGEEMIHELYLPLVAKSEMPFFIKKDNRSFNGFINYLLPKLKINTIVYGNKESHVEFSDELKILRSVNDFSDESFKMFQDFIKISFQEKDPISLYDVIKNASPVKEHISFELFLKLLGKRLEIGKGLEIPQFYTNHRIKIPLLNMQILNEDRWLFVICNCPKNSTAFDKLITVSLATYISDDDDNYIVTTTNAFTLHLVKTIRDRTKKPFCILHYIPLESDCGLSLMYTNENIEFFKPFQTEKCKIVQDDNLLETCCEIPINIICDNPGTGKSGLLNFVSSRFAPDIWVTYVNLWTCANTIKKVSNTQGLIELFCSFIQSDSRSNELEKFYLELCKHCLNTRKLVCLVDDYEEINNPELLKLLEEVSCQGLRIWIVGRPISKPDFEIIFGTYAMEVNEFDKESQCNFFRNFLEYRNPTNPVKTMKELENISNEFEPSFIGKCQQLRMLAELFSSDSGISAFNSYGIEKLYEQFIKLEIRESLNKNKSQVANDIYAKRDFNIISKMALYHFFSKSTLSKIFDWEEFSGELKIFKHEYRKHNLIMGYNEENVPIFTHSTYAEFLVGSWLSKTVKKQIQRTTTLDVKKIVIMLFSIPELSTIRLFFDRMLAHDNPVFINIIKRDYSQVDFTSKQLLDKCDVLGRNPIHMLMSYGCTKYNVGINIQEQNALQSIHKNKRHATLIKHKNTIRLHIPQPTSFPVKSKKKMSNLLNSISKKSLMEKAKFLELTAIDMALLTGSLKELNQVIRRAKLDLKVHELDKIYFLLYHCLMQNFNGILKCLDLSKLKCWEVRNATDMSLLHLAVVSKNVDAVGQLLKMERLENWGADLEGKTPLHLACEYKRTDTEDILKRKRKILDMLCQRKQTSVTFLMQTNNKGRSHLHALAYVGHLNWVNLIPSKGVNVDIQCKAGNTPFMISIINNKLNVATLLKDKNANVNHRNKEQMTALHYAATKNLHECCERLIEWKADVNVKNNYGITPLMRASRWGHENIVSLLLKNHADVNLTNNNKQTALHYAVKFRRKDVLNILIAAGADIHTKNQNGYSPLEIAKRNFCDGYNILSKPQKQPDSKQLRNQIIYLFIFLFILIIYFGYNYLYKLFHH